MVIAVASSKVTHSLWGEVCYGVILPHCAPVVCYASDTFVKSVSWSLWANLSLQATVQAIHEEAQVFRNGRELKQFATNRI